MQRLDTQTGHVFFSIYVLANMTSYLLSLCMDQQIADEKPSKPNAKLLDRIVPSWVMKYIPFRRNQTSTSTSGAKTPTGVTKLPTGGAKTPTGVTKLSTAVTKTPKAAAKIRTDVPKTPKAATKASTGLTQTPKVAAKIRTDVPKTPKAATKTSTVDTIKSRITSILS